MFTMNGKIRREFLKRTAGADAAVTAAGALGAQATPAMVADVPRKWNKNIDVVVVGAGFCGLTACITAGDPSKITFTILKHPCIKSKGKRLSF